MTVSVQVMDGIYGRPVSGMAARFQSRINGTWIEQARAHTNDEGNISDWPDLSLSQGLYRLELDLDTYFSGLGITPFCSAVATVFRIVDLFGAHHISILVTPSMCVTHHSEFAENTDE